MPQQPKQRFWGRIWSRSWGRLCDRIQTRPPKAAESGRVLASSASGIDARQGAENQENNRGPWPAL
jgi:hypothetical protein